MRLSRNLKKTLLIGSAVLMFASVGAGTGNLTANARRRYRPRVARRYHARHYRRRSIRHYRRRPVHHYRHHTTRKHKRVNRSKKSRHNKEDHSIKELAKANTIHDEKLDRKSPKYNAQQSKDAIKQINGYRAAKGLRPYIEDKELDNVAMLRAKNMAKHKEAFSHLDKNGNSYASKDAYTLGYIKNPKSKYFGENIAAGYDSAHSANNDFMYHDAPSWGHRANIMDKNYGNPKYVGTGFYNGFLVEDFAFYPTNKLDLPQNQNYAK